MVRIRMRGNGAVFVVFERTKSGSDGDPSKALITDEIRIQKRVE